MKKKLKCGIIGLSMGIFHLDAVLANGAEIGAVCDVNPETLKKIGDKYEIPEEKRFTDWRELIAIDACSLGVTLSVIISKPYTNTCIP